MSPPPLLAPQGLQGPQSASAKPGPVAQKAGTASIRQPLGAVGDRGTRMGWGDLFLIRLQPKESWALFYNEMQELPTPLQAPLPLGANATPMTGGRPEDFLEAEKWPTPRPSPQGKCRKSAGRARPTLSVPRGPEVLEDPKQHLGMCMSDPEVRGSRPPAWPCPRRLRMLTLGPWPPSLPGRRGWEPGVQEPGPAPCPPWGLGGPESSPWLQ